MGEQPDAIGDSKEGAGQAAGDSRREQKQYLKELGVPGVLCGVTREQWREDLAPWPRAADDWIGDPWLLFLIGPVGCGKSHVACCILQKALSSKKDSPWQAVLPEKNPQGLPVRIGWIDVPLTLRRIRKELALDLTDRKETNRVTRLVERGQLIVLDDVGAERATDFQVDEVQMWLRERYNNQVLTIVTSNHTVETIRKIDARTASRISSGRIIQMKGKDYRAVRDR